MKALFDTNIIIDYLNGNIEAKKIIKKYSKRYISVITWIEVLVGAKSGSEEEKVIKTYLETHFEIVNIDIEISNKAIDIRRHFKIKVPDAIIWATGETLDALIITRNTKDFPEDLPSVIVPYLYDS